MSKFELKPDVTYLTLCRITRNVPEMYVKVNTHTLLTLPSVELPEM